MAARWRNQPNEAGLRMAVQRPRGLQLRDNGVTLLHVAPLVSNHVVTGWYWYGLGQNTCATPTSSMEEAKAEAAAFHKQWRSERASKG